MVTAPRSNAKHLHSTAKGFKTPPTEEQIIQQVIKKGRKLGYANEGVDIFSPSFVSKLRGINASHWNSDAKSNPYPGSRSALLDPSFSLPLDIVDLNGENEGSRYKQFHQGVCGRWMIRTYQHPNSIDFCISVLLPDDSLRLYQSISPLSTQRWITNALGFSTYKKWKELQLADLPSLRRLINEFKDVIDYPCMSMTCSEKSKRLCERVGLPIYKDWAFLIPNSMVS